MSSRSTMLRWPKHILTVIYTSFAILLLILIAYMQLGTGDWVRKEVPVSYTWMFLYFLTPLAVLIYGLVRSRRWVVLFHGVTVLVWLIGWTAIAIGMTQGAIQSHNYHYLLIPIAGLLCPILAQWYLIRIRASLWQPDEASWLKRGAAFVGTVLYSLPLLIFGAFVVPLLFMSGGTAGLRQEICRVENGSYRVIAYFHPAGWISNSPLTTVEAIDLHTLFKSEKTICSGHNMGVRSLAFLDSSTVEVTTTDPDSTTVVNLADPGSSVSLEDRVPWREKLNYAGCLDLDSIENDHYKVIFRKYPAVRGKWGEASRVLFVDKSKLVHSEQSLFLACWVDSVKMQFQSGSSISVKLFLMPGIGRSSLLNASDTTHTPTKIYDLSEYKGHEDEL